MGRIHQLLHHEYWLSEPRIVAGVMSGTSLDGVDVAIARFWQEDGQHRFEHIAEHTLPFARSDYHFYKHLIEERISIAEVCDANIHLMHLYNDAIHQCCEQHSFGISQLDAVGIHGQTVWHSPNKHAVEERHLRSTLQLTSPSSLAQMLGVTVVGDFRSADVAAGGQGAPLVPIFDYTFLTHPTDYTIALNIGGMANITLLPPACTKEDVRAFDTGPGNVWIDALMMKYYGKRYDEQGVTAKAGIIIPAMLKELQEQPFISAPPPKSTGRELFSGEYIDALLRKYAPAIRPPEDVIATLTYFSAWSIAENIRLYAEKNARIIVSGGGAHNSFLLQLLRTELPDAAILHSNSVGISADAKEALCFAYLAYRTIGGMTSNIPTVTGASRECLLGVIALV